MEICSGLGEGFHNHLSEGLSARRERIVGMQAERGCVVVTV